MLLSNIGIMGTGKVHCFSVLERRMNVGEPQRVTSGVEVAQLTPSLAEFAQEIFAWQCH